MFHLAFAVEVVSTVCDMLDLIRREKCHLLVKHIVEHHEQSIKTLEPRLASLQAFMKLYDETKEYQGVRTE